LRAARDLRRKAAPAALARAEDVELEEQSRGRAAQPGQVLATGEVGLQPSAADRSRLARLGLCTAAYAALAALLTWPLATQLATHLPLGALGDPTVPYFNLWSLEWNVQRLVHGYLGYWDAPLFYPARDTFAMSEPQGLTGWLFAPAYWLAGPIAAYNLTLLAQLGLNGLCGRRLLRLMGVSHVVADLGGALFVGLPLVRHELGVLQLCAAWPVLLALGELVILAREPSAAALLRLGLWLVATAWTCVYYLLFLGLFALLAVPFYTRPALLARRPLLALGASAVLVLAGLYPLVAAERRAVGTHTRSAAAIRSGSGSVLAYVEPPRGSPLLRLFPGWSRPAGRRSLYPGALTCALALLGLWKARRVPPPRFYRFALALFVLALFLSFGTRWHFAGISPYALTVERFLPGFGQVRSPYRAALFVQIVLCGFAGLGLERALGWARARRLQLAAAVPGLCVALALAEIGGPGAALARFPEEALHEPWIAWLSRQAPGAVAMLPVTAGGQSAAYEDTALGMLQALRHGHPLVNGYSGFFPERTDRLMARLRRFPNGGAVSALREVGVRYVVVDRRKAIDAVPEGLTPVFASGPRTVLRVE
jgi:hypothetical protein